MKLRDQIQEKVDYEKYSPKCTISDLNKMIDYDAYKGRNSFKNVESKIKRTQSASNYKMLPRNILGISQPFFFSLSIASKTKLIFLFITQRSNEAIE